MTEKDTQWIPLDQIQTVKFEPIEFSEEEQGLIRRIHARLKDVLQKSERKFMEGLVYEGKPHKQLALWNRISLAYENLLATNIWTDKQRREIFTTLIYCTMMPSTQVVLKADNSVLSRHQVDRVTAIYTDIASKN